MEKVSVNLKPLVRRVNLPTVIKTAILPGDDEEKIFIATQVGEIYYLDKGSVETFLDIRPNVLKLGSFGGYDERGLLGLAFHPNCYANSILSVNSISSRAPNLFNRSSNVNFRFSSPETSNTILPL
ncbi:MAG: hypothetical protein WBK54_01405, partial [Bacilli bacterium]